MDTRLLANDSMSGATTLTITPSGFRTRSTGAVNGLTGNLSLASALFAAVADNLDGKHPYLDKWLLDADVFLRGNDFAVFVRETINLARAEYGLPEYLGRF